MPRTLLPALLWGGALVALYFLDPTRVGPSLCLFKALGLPGCPGCGLGHAVHYALHGAWTQSFRAHWLGLPATGALLHQTIQPLFRHNRLKRFTWTNSN